jgi:hypothetical protein
VTVPDPWFSLAEALVKSNSAADFAALHDTIGREGIWRLDEFSRPQFCAPTSEHANWARNYVLHVFNWERHGPPPGEEDRPEPSYGEGDPDDQTVVSGWPQSDPVFNQDIVEPAGAVRAVETELAIGRTAICSPPERPAFATTKRLNSCLIIIAGLMKALKLDHTKRGVAAEVLSHVEFAGLTLTDDTVRNILQGIPGALGRRDSGNQEALERRSRDR